MSRSCPLVVVVTLTVLTSCLPQRGLESVSLLIDVAAAASGEGGVAYETVIYEVAGRSHSGDLYQPAGLEKGRAVVVPGLAPAGKDDPRLIAFASAMGNAGLLVLTPEIPNIRRLEARPEDASKIADAIRFLSTHSRADPGPPVMLVAFSYAVGPAILAALQPEVRERVGVILGVGGYYDIDAVVTFFTTGNYRIDVDAPWRYQTPNAYGKWVFARSNARSLADPVDRATLVEIADRKLNNPDAEIGHLVPQLGREGRSVLSLLLNEDPERTPALVAELPTNIRQDMAGLDLKTRDLSLLEAELLLVHGRDDAIIPYTETLALAATLPPERVTVGLGSARSATRASPRSRSSASMGVSDSRAKLAGGTRMGAWVSRTMMFWKKLVRRRSSPNNSWLSARREAK